MAELLNTTIKATGDTEDPVLNVTKNDANSSSILNIKENGDISITNTNGIEIKINNNGSIDIKDSSEGNILSISGNGVITVNKELAIADDAKTTGIFSGNSVFSSTEKENDTQKITIPKIEIANGKVSFSTSTIDLPKYAGSSSADGPANSVANSLTFSTTGSGDTGSYNGEAPKTISYNSIGALSDTTTYVSAVTEGTINGTISVSTNDKVENIAVRGLGSASYKNAGYASGNVPKNAIDLYVTVGSSRMNKYKEYPVLIDNNGNLIPGGAAIGDAAYKTVGASAGHVPYISTSLYEKSTADSSNSQINFPVLIDNSGYLKPGDAAIGDAAYRDVNGSGNFVAVNSSLLNLSSKLILDSNAHIEKNGKDIFSYNSDSGILTINY